MAAKKIKIMGGYEIQFDQKAKGQETPYYVGRIYKDGEQVGHFNNDGNGGMTMIHPPAVVTDFNKMVDDSAKTFKIDVSKEYERAGEVIGFAARFGYSRNYGKFSAEDCWKDWMEQFVKETKDLRAMFPNKD